MDILCGKENDVEKCCIYRRIRGARDGGRRDEGGRSATGDIKLESTLKRISREKLGNKRIGSELLGIFNGRKANTARKILYCRKLTK